GGVERTFGPKLFATYRLLAEARKHEWPGTGPDGDEVEDGPGHAGWLSVPQICCGRIPSGRRIDGLLLQHIKEGVVAQGGDPDGHRSVLEWENVVAEQDPKNKLRRAETAIGSIKRLMETIETAFGAPAFAIIGPDRREERQSRPIRGGEI